MAQFRTLEGQLCLAILAACTDIVIFSFPPFYPRISKVHLPISPQDYRGQTCFCWAPFGYASNSLPDLLLVAPVLQNKTSHKELRALRQTAASEKQRHEEAEVDFRPVETGGSRLGPGGSLLPTGDGISMHFCLFVV